MGKFDRSGLFVIWLLAVCLMPFPTWAAGAGKDTGFSLRLHGGTSNLKATDANTGSGGWLDLEAYWSRVLGYTTEGGYSPFHDGYDFGADLIYHFSPRLGVGLGVGYLQSSETSTMTFTNSEDTVLVKYTPKMSAMPIRLGVYGAWPLAGKLNLTANAGVAYYAAVKYEAPSRFEHVETEIWAERSITASMNRLGNIGFQGGLGVEYELSRRMFVFVEALGRYANFKNFDKATVVVDTSAGGPHEAVGKIYLLTLTSPDITLSWFDVYETTPPPEEGVEYREPKFDFSGFSFQVGLRIRF